MSLYKITLFPLIITLHLKALTILNDKTYSLLPRFRVNIEKCFLKDWKWLKTAIPWQIIYFVMIPQGAVWHGEFYKWLCNIHKYRCWSFCVHFVLPGQPLLFEWVWYICCALLVCHLHSPLDGAGLNPWYCVVQVVHEHFLLPPQLSTTVMQVVINMTVLVIWDIVYNSILAKKM